MTDVTPDMPPDDERFVLAHATWRQFHALCLDRPAPTQPEIDGRLKLYQRSREVAAMRHFGVATVLLAGIAKTLTDMGHTYGSAIDSTGALLFVVTCVVLVIAGAHCLTRMRDAVDARGIASRIDVEPIPWSRIDTLFADTRDADVRAYLDDVRNQGRSLRRAEAAVAYERAKGGGAAVDASAAAFRRFVRGRPAVLPREYAAGAACVFAVLLVNQSSAAPAMVLPPLFVLAAWSLGDLLSNLVELISDPWELNGELHDGGRESTMLRRLLMFDLSPSIAVILAVTAVHIAIATLA